MSFVGHSISSRDLSLKPNEMRIVILLRVCHPQNIKEATIHYEQCKNKEHFDNFCPYICAKNMNKKIKKNKKKKKKKK